MFNLFTPFRNWKFLTGFKPKCPVCKMELEKGREYVKGFGKEFCSENCREEFRQKLVKEQSNAAKRGGSCH